MIRIAVTTVALTLVQTLAAAGQDLKLLGGGALVFGFEGGDTEQELSGYLEAERFGFYGGALGLVSTDIDQKRVDLYGGYRAETATGFSYDLSYTRSYYPNDGGNCCGEIALALGQTVGEALNLSGELTYQPEASLAGIEVGAEYFVTERLAISANLGTFEQDTGSSATEWDVGVKYGLNEASDLNLRYYDQPDTDGRIELSLTFETSLLGR